MNDCVATAPTPGSAQATELPTLNQCDCTATPIWPVAESTATIEYVCAGRRTGSWAAARHGVRTPASTASTSMGRMEPP
jgi:hypothetical protein